MIPRSSGTVFPPIRSNTPLFEALVCETHHAAAMCVIVASCIHGSAQKRHHLTQTALDRYLPHEPAVLLSLTRQSLLDVEPLSETQAVIDAFFVSLRFLRRAVESYFFDVSEIGLERAHVLNMRNLVQAANRSCHDALRAVHALEIETPGRLPELYCDHAKVLSALLIRSERGEMPCLDGHGLPFLPVLPQRRRSTRRTLAQSCRLLYRRAIVSAFAKDVSDGGIGLLQVPFLQTDDRVIVELKSGRQFKGSIAWTRGEAAGLRFDEPLGNSDPLLAL
jgi:hypothetical protein